MLVLASHALGDIATLPGTDQGSRPARLIQDGGETHMIRPTVGAL